MRCILSLFSVCEARAGLINGGIDMLNGAGMLHGGCVAYLIDKCVWSSLSLFLQVTAPIPCSRSSVYMYSCCSTPLVVLGLTTGTNGVGVTQALNILFHAPAPL